MFSEVNMGCTIPLIVAHLLGYSVATAWHLYLSCRRKHSDLKDERLQLFCFYLPIKRNISLNFPKEGVSGTFWGFLMKQINRNLSYEQNSCVIQEMGG